MPVILRAANDLYSTPSDVSLMLNMTLPSLTTINCQPSTK